MSRYICHNSFISQTYDKIAKNVYVLVQKNKNYSSSGLYETSVMVFADRIKN